MVVMVSPGAKVKLAAWMSWSRHPMKDVVWLVFTHPNRLFRPSVRKTYTYGCKYSV